MDYSKKQRLTRNLATLRDCEKAVPVGVQNNMMNQEMNTMMNNKKMNQEANCMMNNQMMNQETKGMMNNQMMNQEANCMMNNGMMNNDMMNNGMMEGMEQFPLAMAYVPWQHINTVYDSRKALKIGTIFPELDLPFCGVRGGRV